MPRRSSRRSRPPARTAQTQQTPSQTRQTGRGNGRSRRQPTRADARPESPRDKRRARRRRRRKKDVALYVGIGAVVFLGILIVAIASIAQSDKPAVSDAPTGQTAQKSGDRQTDFRRLAPMVTEQGTIRQGMSRRQVRAIFGDPMGLTERTSETYGREEVWEYGDAAMFGGVEKNAIRIYFDRNGRVYRYVGNARTES